MPVAEGNIWVERAGQNLSHLTSDIKATYSPGRNPCWEFCLASTQHITIVRRARKAGEKLLGRSSSLGRSQLRATQPACLPVKLKLKWSFLFTASDFPRTVLEPLILFWLLCMDLTNDGSSASSRCHDCSMWDMHSDLTGEWQSILHRPTEATSMREAGLKAVF